MTNPIPYLDATGFANRSLMAAGDIAIVTGNAPTFFATLEADERQRMNGRLLKRCPVPFGLSQPGFNASGTAPPVVTSLGLPTVGSNELVIAITTPGALGTALFKWSSDGGITWQATGVATAASVLLGSTGISAVFPSTYPGVLTPAYYSADNVFAAPTPVPRVVLRWLAKIMTPEMFRKRGVDERDPQIGAIAKESAEAIADLLEFANSDTGLWDIPVNDASTASSMVEGGPFAYSESSPWEAFDKQEHRAHKWDDRHG